MFELRECCNDTGDKSDVQLITLASMHDEKCLNSYTAWTGLDRSEYRKQYTQEHPDEKKLIAYLARQGFEYNEIKQALDENNK